MPVDSDAHQTPRAAPSPRRARLLLFARLPVPGKAKTRLAAGIGIEAAAEVYRVCAEHVFREALRCPDVAPEVHCSNSAEAPAVAAWLARCGCSMPVVPQLDSPDLGARLLTAVTSHPATAGTRKSGSSSSSSSTGDHNISGCASSEIPQRQSLSKPSRADRTPVIVAGTDVPDLSAAVFSAAAAAVACLAPTSDPHTGQQQQQQQQIEQQQQLQNAPAAATADVAIGPAADGGYYLLALSEAVAKDSELAAPLFRDVPWSTPDVAAATHAAAARAGLRVLASGSHRPDEPVLNGASKGDEGAKRKPGVEDALAMSQGLPVLRDIDTAADLAEWVAQQQQQQQQQQQRRQQQQHPLLPVAEAALRLWSSESMG